MKKLIIILTLFFVSLLAPLQVFAATLVLNPSSGTINKGCQAEIAIELDTQGAQTDGTDAIVIYPTNIFSTTVAQITPNTSLYQDYPGNSVDAATGKISVSGLASTTKPFVGKGTMATIKFSVSADAPVGPATLKFDFDPNDKSKTTDSNIVEHGTVVDLLSSVIDGNYTIGTGPCSSLASSGSSKGGLVGTPSAGSPLQYKTLPQSGMSLPTMVFAGIGAAFIILGIIAIALL